MSGHSCSIDATHAMSYACGRPTVPICERARQYILGSKRAGVVCFFCRKPLSVCRGIWAL